MTPLATFYTGMVAVLFIESVIPSPGRAWSFGAACFGIVLIGLEMVYNAQL